MAAAAPVRYEPNNRDFGLFIMTRRGNPAHGAAVRVAAQIANQANATAAAITHKKPTEQQSRLKINPRARTPLAGSYKTRDAIWLSKKYPTPRATQMVYSDDDTAAFNEFGVRPRGGGPKRQERHILRNAGRLVAVARNGGR